MPTTQAEREGSTRQRSASRARVVAPTFEGKYTGLEKRKVRQNVSVNGARTTTVCREGPCVA